MNTPDLTLSTAGRRIRASLIATVAAVSVATAGLTLASSPARAEAAWTLKYDLDPADGMNCSMETYWDDGSEFSIFANANDFVGFYIMDPAWSLREGQESFVTFRFGRRDYSFPVSAVDRTSVVGDLASNESTALQFLERWARAYSMSIVFPQGNSWPVNLNGTMATFRQWTTCHDQLERIIRRRGGGGFSGGGGNPFGGGSGNSRPSSNPF